MLAVIAGSGVQGLVTPKTCVTSMVLTKYGTAEICTTEAANEDIFFLPRHGLSHSTLPHLINHRANIAALAKCGVKRILAVCAVGSLREDLPPGSLVLVDDFLNTAGSSLYTFFSMEGSALVHTDMNHPYCPQMREVFKSAASDCNIEIVPSGCYVGVLGPRYESASEIRAFRLLGGDIVGMTSVPECILAREAGICYAAIAIVTNYGTGLTPRTLQHSEVSAAAESALPKLKSILHCSMPELKKPKSCTCPAAQVNILE